MPLYEYACKRCGNFEVTQRISDEPLKKCPTCGAKVSKLISRSAFHLKGGGWYMTDYGKNGSDSSKADDAKPAAEGAKDTASSSASAPSSPTVTKESAPATKETSSTT